MQPKLDGPESGLVGDLEARHDVLDRLAASALVLRAAEHEVASASHRELLHDAALELHDAIVRLRMMLTPAPSALVDVRQDAEAVPGDTTTYD
jgi:hypothetical protein